VSVNAQQTRAERAFTGVRSHSLAAKRGARPPPYPPGRSPAISAGAISNAATPTTRVAPALRQQTRHPPWTSPATSTSRGTGYRGQGTRHPPWTSPATSTSRRRPSSASGQAAAAVASPRWATSVSGPQPVRQQRQTEEEERRQVQGTGGRGQRQTEEERRRGKGTGGSAQAEQRLRTCPRRMAAPCPLYPVPSCSHRHVPLAAKAKARSLPRSEIAPPSLSTQSSIPSSSAAPVCPCTQTSADRWLDTS